MKMNIISRGKLYRNPPFEILQDTIFVFEKKKKRKSIEKGITCNIAGYNIIRVHKLDGSYEPPCLLPAFLVSRERHLALTSCFAELCR